MPVVQDLLDTLKANRMTCVGMAANMIGSLKRIIVVHTDRGDEIFINPVIEKKADPFEAEEGCLSLVGTRKTTRYRKIQVFYQDRRFRKHRQTFTGWTAQIIQHECDHLDGIII
nr:peptide deformylase [uncultured Megasphaera sp.]